MTAASEAQAKLAAVREQADALTTLARLVEERRREVVLEALEAGLSQSEIARQLALAPSRVHQIVNNTR